MAYLGTTSTAPNPPAKVLSTIGSTFGGGWTQWVYRSTNTVSSVEGANFFTDGKALGMTVGDLLIAVESTVDITSHKVIAVGATTTDLGVGSTLGKI